MNLDTKKIVALLKSNIVITICVIVILAALIGLPYVSSGFEEEVTKAVEKKSKNYKDLKRIRDGKITIPGASPVAVVANRSIIDRIQSIANVRKDQSVSVLDEAESSNRGSHANLDMKLFPGLELPEHELLVESPRFQKRILEEYKALLANINAGMPPTLETVMKSLEQVQQQFLDRDLKKDSIDELEPDELELVRADLSDRRIDLYLREAESTGIYLNLATLSPPAYDERRSYTLHDLFLWQWRFWIVSEVLEAFKDVNGDKATVLTAPIKRVLKFQVRDLMDLQEAGSASSSGGSSAPSGSSTPIGPQGSGGSRPVGPQGSGGIRPVGPQGSNGGGSKRAPAGGGGGSFSRGGGSSSSGGSKSVEEELIVAEVPAPGSTNFDVSLTGRISNALYDVVLVDVTLIVDKDHLADTLQSLVASRFLTIRDLTIERAQVYEALAMGFLYGESPVIKLDLTIETIWLRSWTQEYMPNTVRAALGIQPAKIESSEDSEDDDFS
ncbi:MAG: hypothetical protein VX527_00285 [Planctomycetota bacterium]|nr:hypothetical protein [Planctomycetota bacterium]